MCKWGTKGTLKSFSLFSVISFFAPKIVNSVEILVCEGMCFWAQDNHFVYVRKGLKWCWIAGKGINNLWMLTFLFKRTFQSLRYKCTDHMQAQMCEQIRRMRVFWDILVSLGLSYHHFICPSSTHFTVGFNQNIFIDAYFHSPSRI